MRRSALILLCFGATVFVGIVIDYVLSRNRPICIYQIEAHRITSSKDICMEAFCVYNYRWKSEREINDSIIAYDARTIHKDSILKYKKLYRRTFLKNKGEINKDYNNRHDKEYVYYLPDYYLFSIYREVIADKKVKVYISEGEKCYSIDSQDTNGWLKVLDVHSLLDEDRTK